MFVLLILLAMAYAQDNYGRNLPTYVWAGMFALMNFIIRMLGGVFLASLVLSVMLGLYAWGYFALLRRFSDQTLLWLLICLGGLILPTLFSVAMMP